MNEIDILEKIIEEKGSCNWVLPHICDVCPLGKLTRDSDGSYISCAEALAIDGLSESEADARYERAAADKLAEMAIEKAMKDT